MALLILHIVLYGISQLLNTHLDRDQLATCVAMIENGVNPEALAVREIFHFQLLSSNIALNVGRHQRSSAK